MKTLVYVYFIIHHKISEATWSYMGSWKFVLHFIFFKYRVSGLFGLIILIMGIVSLWESILANSPNHIFETAAVNRLTDILSSLKFALH